MEDRGVITISRTTVFDRFAAEQVLPVIRRFTAEFAKEVDNLLTRINTTTDKIEVDRLENQINILIQRWHVKIKKLGAQPKGLWLVDFDTGDGYFCWKFPEPTLRYWHGYQCGFSNRILIEEKPGLASGQNSARKSPAKLVRIDERRKDCTP